jgi:FkbM family methyltransferase
MTQKTDEGLLMKTECSRSLTFGQMGIRSTLTYITSHPLNRDRKLAAVRRFLGWQFASRVIGCPVVHPFTQRSRLIVGRGMTGATGNYYCGLHDFADMAFLLHFLRPKDLFIDAGANIGSYTVLASAHCGAETHCFEPVPQTYRRLLDNIAINHIGNLAHARNTALGAAAGALHFTARFDTVNHVLEAPEQGSIEVPVARLDDVVSIDQPALLKIDVEGYEYPVIQGGLENFGNPLLKAVIIELNGLGNQFGYSDQSIHDTLVSLGLSPWTYDPFTRSLSPQHALSHLNTLYLRDTAFVQERIRTAEPIHMHGKRF